MTSHKHAGVFAVCVLPVRRGHAIFRASHVLVTRLANDLAPKSFVSLNRSSLTSCRQRSAWQITPYGRGECARITGPSTWTCAGRSCPNPLSRWALFSALRLSLQIVRRSLPVIAIPFRHGIPAPSPCPFDDHESQPSPYPHSFLCPARGLFQGPFPCMTPGRPSRPPSVRHGTRRSPTLPCDGSLRIQPARPQPPFGKRPFSERSPV
jgi:hypothetical protein